MDKEKQYDIIELKAACYDCWQSIAEKTIELERLKQQSAELEKEIKRLSQDADFD